MFNLLRWAALPLPVALGDGELLLSSSTSTPTASTTRNVTIDCNPYDGHQFFIFGNGNGITSEQCGASWDLYEVSFWDENGDPIAVSEASSLTGTAPSVQSGINIVDYSANNAVDGHNSTFFAGDYDVGMACSCWNSGKLDGQSLLVDLGSTKKVSKIMLLQGGAGDIWAISNIRIHCGNSYQTHPLPLEISFGETDIECNAGGCQTTRLDPAYFHTCDSDAPVVDNADAVTAPLPYILLWMLWH